jgi:hypothetical protein
MIRNDRIQADILDRALQRMLEGNAAVADSEYAAASEARLLGRIKTSVSRPVRRESSVMGEARGGWIRTAALVAVTTMVVVCASGLGVTSASAQALPGDALYPMKQGLEEISLTFSMSAVGDVALLADFADDRLAEVEELAAKDREADLVSGLDNYDNTLSRLDAAMEQLPSDSPQLDDIRARLAWHTEVLLTLRDRLPEQARPALERAVEHSQKSMERVGKLQKNQGPDEIPPGQEKKSTEDAVRGSDSSSPTEKKPDTNLSTGSPESTQPPKDSKSTRVSKTPRPSKTPEPTKPPKDKTKE